jgi:peptidoglycan/LPS O-acetylase OafA/YrhL
MERLSRLDGLRGVLAVYIMLCHAFPYTTLPPWFAGLFYHGEAVVDLFFALSGLVVINSLERFNYRFWAFLNGRASRLLPVYFSVLVLAVVLLSAGSPLPAMPWIAPGSDAGLFWSKGVAGLFVWHVAAHVFLLQGLLPQGILPWAWITVLGPAWSLSTEWQFYILMALVVARLRGGRRLTHFAFLMLAVGVCYQAAAPRLPAFWQFNRAFLPDGVPYFALGLASAVWLRSRNPMPFLLCLATVFALGLHSGVPEKAFTCIAWTFVLLAQRHPEMPILPKVLDSRMAQFLGAISYPLYLINQPAQRGCAMLIAPLMHGNATAFTLLWLPVALAASILAAVALHYGVEIPGMKLGRPGPGGVQVLSSAESGRRIFTR